MRRTRKDHSGLPKDKLPPVPKSDLIFYHWSPTAKRPSILRTGLETGKRSLQGNWKPPYVCFSDDPWLAWILSGRMWPNRYLRWDLWLCNVEMQTSFDHYEIITDTTIDTGRPFIKEYRVYTRVYKRDLIYIATREE